MERWPAFVAICIVLVLLAASAATPAPSRSLEIQVWAHEAWTRSLDTFPKGPSRGDVVVRHDILRNASHRNSKRQFGKAEWAVVGSARYRAKFESATSAFLRATVTLPGGKIRCRGRVDPSEAVDVKHVTSVTGGKGVFAGGTGRCNTFHLRPEARLRYKVHRRYVYQLFGLAPQPKS